MTSPPHTSADTYRQRRAAFDAEERRLARVSFRFSLLRGGLFVGFVACLGILLVRASSLATPGWWLAAAVWLVVFFAVLPIHDRVIGEQRRAADLRDLNDEALLRIERAWDRLPVPSVAVEGRNGIDGPLARDLDLFGRASLFQLLGTAHTPAGKAMLAGWLLHPAPPEEIARRQAAVSELAPEVEHRQRIEVRTRPLERKPPDLDRFLHWAEGEPWLLSRPALVWLTRLLPAATVGLALAAVFTDLPVWPALTCVTLNLMLSYAQRERMEETLNRVQAREGELLRFAEAMEVVVSRSASAEELRRIAGVLAPESRPAHMWMDLLHRRVVLSDARHSALLHFPLQLLLLWDFHTVWLLEHWQRSVGRQVRGWLAALGEVEALGSLAGLRFDNPDWAFPAVAAGEGCVAARDLGHPLIAAGYRVGNDVEIGPSGTFLLVTGSNMSGKSTLLRSIGINTILAQAGGPVCAREMRLPPLEIATSILIEDSLAAGVSFFMAEVLRIKTVVEAADQCAAEGRKLLYLLDEILRGTNSSERQVAVRSVVRHLLRQGAIGAVSTHDLQLAEIEELRAACIPVHFRETIHPGGEGPAMTFDYEMRPGVATTVNALKLMELVGLTPD